MAQLTTTKMGTCAHCGTYGPVTDDHIPPKNLWKGGKPSNLITVPSCDTCNEQRTLDDEYFRVALLMPADTSAGVPATALAAVMRSLQNPRQQRFRDQILGSIEERTIRMPGGLIVRVPVFSGDSERVNRVARHVVTGLFFHHLKHPLPASYVAEAFVTNGLAPTNARPWQGLVAKLIKVPPNTIGEGVFDYWFAPTAEDPNTTFWILLFYRKTAFLGLTLSQSAASADEGHAATKEPA